MKQKLAYRIYSNSVHIWPKHAKGLCLFVIREMFVGILRHGEAEAQPGSDGDRHLTERGSAQVRTVLVLASQMGFQVGAIASSPLTRAKQTAEITKNIFHRDYEITNSLEPEGSPEEVYEDLSKHESENGILLISHQPLVSKLLSDLLGCEARVALTTGTLAVVKVSGTPGTGRGELILLVPPQMQIS